MTDFAKARESFPFVTEAVYLNTATAGLAWTGLGEASTAFYEAKLRGIYGRDEWVAGAQLLAVSHVHWRTGTTVDLGQIAAACRASGTWLIVDGVQAVGSIPVNAGLADAYCGSSFKWLLGGFGLGFLALSERLAREWTPPFRGYANEWPSRDPQYGHLDYPGIYALGASLAFLGSLGWEAIFRRVAQLSSRLSDQLLRHGLELLTPRAATAGIVSIRRDDAGELVERLTQESIFVEDRDSILRASPHLYNTETEIDRFVTALMRR
jgi:cysteine desulfurase / selenocysteine lyase